MAYLFSNVYHKNETKTDIQDRIYQNGKNTSWSKGNEAYVKTTNDKDKDVVLSESQSYGMLITVRAAKKGLANQKILKDSTSIICHIVLKAIN